VHCQKPDCCLIDSVRTFVEACLDWNRVPVRAKDLNAELEERARIDIVRVRERTDRSRRPCILLMGGFPNDPFRLCISVGRSSAQRSLAPNSMELLYIGGKKLAYTKTANTATTGINQIGPCLLHPQINRHEESRVEVGEGDLVVGVVAY